MGAPASERSDVKDWRCQGTLEQCQLPVNIVEQECDGGVPVQLILPRHLTPLSGYDFVAGCGCDACHGVSFHGRPGDEKPLPWAVGAHEAIPFPTGRSLTRLQDQRPFAWMVAQANGRAAL
ncbi:hypothetical protein D9M69_649740 [compost metagenome]